MSPTVYEQQCVNYRIIDDSICTGDFTDCQDAIVVIREEVIQHPFKSDWGTYTVHYDVHQALEEQGFSKTYDCGSVSASVK